MSAEKVALDAVLENSKGVEQALFLANARINNLEHENESMRRQLDRINDMTNRPREATDQCEAQKVTLSDRPKENSPSCLYCGC